MNSKFICFIGLDGSGKSTHSKFLYEKMLLENSKTKYVYGRFIPYFSKFLMKFGRKIFLKNKNKNYNVDLKNKRKIIKNRPYLSKIYFNTIILETYFQILIKIKLPLIFGYSIVADRYIQDTIINEFAVDLDLSINETNKLLKKSLRHIPKPDKIFFIDIPEETAFERKDDIPSLDYLKIRSKYYRNLEFSKLASINGKKSLEEIQKTILKEMEN